MKTFRFMIETLDDKGEKKRSFKSVMSMHLSGAIRKLYQSYENVNLVRICG